MSDTEYRDFVTAGTRTAKWATTRRDGRPHVVPVWFVVEGDDLVVISRSVLRDPRVGLCIDDDRPPYAFVLIQGCAGVSTAGKGMLLVRIAPEKVVSENNITGEQEQATIMSTGRR
jgi:hypothetical protein